VLCQCCDRDFQSCTRFDRDDTLPCLDRIVLTVIGRLPSAGHNPYRARRHPIRMPSGKCPEPFRAAPMFDRKLADHLVIGDLDALVGRDATLIAAMTPQLP
jgi:hypothetical protein